MQSVLVELLLLAAVLSQTLSQRQTKLCCFGSAAHTMMNRRAWDNGNWQLCSDLMIRVRMRGVTPLCHVCELLLV